jgi:hypothetical protein
MVQNRVMSRKSALAMLLIGIMTTTVSSSALSAPGTRTRAVMPSSDSSATSHLSVRPRQGPGGTQVRVAGYADHACGKVRIAFTDSVGVTTQLTVTHAGTFQVKTNIPLGAALGDAQVTATWLIPGINGCTTSTTQVSTPFTVIIDRHSQRERTAKTRSIHG